MGPADWSTLPKRPGVDPSLEVGDQLASLVAVEVRAGSDHSAIRMSASVSVRSFWEAASWERASLRWA